MGYKENAVYYRQKFFAAIKSGKLTEAKIYSVAYSKLLRDLADRTDSYVSRAKLVSEALKYEDYAIALLKEGISANLKYAVENDVSLNKKSSAPTTAPSPVAVAPSPKEPPVTSPTPPPSLLHSSDVEWSADTFDRYKGATVEILVKKSNYVASGTGFFISDDGLLLTNHHVAYATSGSPATEIRITSGDEKIVTTAKIIAADKEADIALLKANHIAGKTPFIPFVADDTTVRAGIDVMIIGNGLSFGLAPVTGTVKFPDLSDDLVYTAQTNGGDSGSPLINRHGECVGIHKAREDENGSKAARGIAYATPAHIIKKLLSDWRKSYNL